MQTTITIDDNLLQEAAKLANTDNQSQLVEMALSEFIQHHQLTQKKPRILDLLGAGGIREDYDYKALRN